MRTTVIKFWRYHQMRRGLNLAANYMQARLDARDDDYASLNDHALLLAEMTRDVLRATEILRRQHPVLAPLVLGILPN